MRFSRILQPVRRSYIDVSVDNGCLEADAFDRDLEYFATSNAVPFESLHLRADQDAPVIDFGSLESFFARRKKRYALGGPRFSWAFGDFFYNQNPLGSCTGHAAAHAYMASNRHIILHHGKTLLKDINPIGAWFRSKNWSTRGGQSVARMAAEINEFGNTPASEIGRNNTQPNRSRIEAAAEAAALNQSGICFFKPTVESIINFARSEIGTFLGNRVRVSDVKLDRNNMPVPIFSGKWAHATAFTDYVYHEGTDYVYWLNSWGAIYRHTCVYGSPLWGCWMTPDLLEFFLQGANDFGNGVAVFAE